MFNGATAGIVTGLELGPGVPGEFLISKTWIKNPLQTNAREEIWKSSHFKCLLPLPSWRFRHLFGPSEPV
jgi:hypothetical protein